MFVAMDADKNRIKIEDAIKGVQYFCPICNEKVEFHCGSIRQHHYKHWKKSECLDKWNHDMSDWHLAWQNHFPLENQEIVVKDENEIHRADVLFGKTVVEFQHSKLSPEEFQERNSFYTKNGYKIVWLFDLTEEMKNEKLEKNDDPGKYIWKYSFSTFSGFDTSSKEVFVFFQFYDNENDKNPCIKRLLRRQTDQKLTKEFETNHPETFTAEDFIQLITNEYFERGISLIPPFDERKNNIYISERQKYGYKCIVSVKNEGVDYNEIEAKIKTEIRDHGLYIYSPMYIRVKPLYSYGVYSEIQVELWTVNAFKIDYNQIVKDISNIIKKCIPNYIELKSESLVGRKIRKIFEEEPSVGKGLINLETGADVYVKKEHIYKNDVFGRLERNGKYPGSNYGIFRSEKDEWVIKFNYQ